MKENMMSETTGTKRTKSEVIALLREWENKLHQHITEETDIHNAVRSIYEIVENLKDELKQLEK